VILALNLPSYRVEQAQRRKPRAAHETPTADTANDNGNGFKPILTSRSRGRTNCR